MIYFSIEELEKMTKPVLMRLATYFEIPHTSATSKPQLVELIHQKYGIRDDVPMSARVARANRVGE
jgi:hypothetical protein